MTPCNPTILIKIRELGIFRWTVSQQPHFLFLVIMSEFSEFNRLNSLEIKTVVTNELPLMHWMLPTSSVQASYCAKQHASGSYDTNDCQKRYFRVCENMKCFFVKSSVLEGTSHYICNQATDITINFWFPVHCKTTMSWTIRVMSCEEKPTSWLPWPSRRWCGTHQWERLVTNMKGRWHEKLKKKRR